MGRFASLSRARLARSSFRNSPLSAFWLPIHPAAFVGRNCLLDRRRDRRLRLADVGSRRRRTARGLSFRGLVGRPLSLEVQLAIRLQPAPDAPRRRGTGFEDDGAFSIFPSLPRAPWRPLYGSWLLLCRSRRARRGAA